MQILLYTVFESVISFKQGLFFLQTL